MDDIKNLITDLKTASEYEQNADLHFLLNKAAQKLKILREQLKRMRKQNRWRQTDDPSLMKLWGEYRQRTADIDYEVIVMIAGATVPTAAYFDGESFYDGVDPVPVVYWRPFPEPPKVERGSTMEKGNDEDIFRRKVK